jgi:hypothetical protein
MKRVFLIIGILVASTMLGFAQCFEVKGVETKRLEERDRDGIEFNNTNRFTVTVEAELRVPAYSKSRRSRSENYFTVDTRTFVLEANGKHLWEYAAYYATYTGKRSNRAKTYVVMRVFRCPER